MIGRTTLREHLSPCGFRPHPFVNLWKRLREQMLWDAEALFKAFRGCFSRGNGLPAEKKHRHEDAVGKGHPEGIEGGSEIEIFQRRDAEEIFEGLQDKERECFLMRMNVSFPERSGSLGNFHDLFVNRRRQRLIVFLQT